MKKNDKTSSEKDIKKEQEVQKTIETPEYEKTQVSNEDPTDIKQETDEEEQKDSLGKKLVMGGAAAATVGIGLANIITQDVVEPDLTPDVIDIEVAEPLAEVIVTPRHDDVEAEIEADEIAASATVEEVAQQVDEQQALVDSDDTMDTEPMEDILEDEPIVEPEMPEDLVDPTIIKDDVAEIVQDDVIDMDEAIVEPGIAEPELAEYEQSESELEEIELAEPELAELSSDVTEDTDDIVEPMDEQDVIVEPEANIHLDLANVDSADIVYPDQPIETGQIDVDIQESDLIDPLDEDPTLFAINERTEFVDGDSVSPAVDVTADNGEEFMVVDSDGDGVYESIYDKESGEFYASSGAGINDSDIDDMLSNDDDIINNDIDTTDDGLIASATHPSDEFIYSDSDIDVDDIGVDDIDVDDLDAGDLADVEVDGSVDDMDIDDIIEDLGGTELT